MQIDFLRISKYLNPYTKKFKASLNRQTLFLISANIVKNKISSEVWHEVGIRKLNVAASSFMYSFFYYYTKARLM